MFNEKSTEYDSETGKNLPVQMMPKYKTSRDAAIKLLQEKKYMEESDFWILMGRTKKKDKMLYTGLIISHNGCLKLNDNADEAKKFRAECVSLDKDGYNNSLVYTYCCPEQGIYEVGEVSAKNLKSQYPYAMAFKRCYDRVVLKLCGLAFYGVYADSEADEFKEDKERALPDEKPLRQMTNDEFGAVVNGEAIEEKEYQCADCKERIEAFGKYTARQIAETSEKEFGIRLCVECGKKARARIEATKKNAG